MNHFERLIMIWTKIILLIQKKGVPAENTEIVSFFQHRGYSAAWTSVNMVLSYDEIDYSKLNIPPSPENVHYRLLLADEMPMLFHAVEKHAQIGWLEVYQNCSDPIFIAEKSGQIVGFEILSPEGGRFMPKSERVGSIGCVGVLKEFQNQGIGLQMVVEGCKWLKQQGSTAIELRYVELVEWYKRVGFRVIRHQWMGEKQL